MLKKLISKKQLSVIGVNTGTSCDGLDIALIRFTPSGKRPYVEFIEGRTLPFPNKIKQPLERLITSDSKNGKTIARHDIALGTFIGESVRDFARKTKHKIDLIASHGQTIGHYPDKQNILGNKTAATLQIGDGNAIACAANMPVVSDFRKADIALGGEGAPLTPFCNHLLFAHKKHSRLIVNIGGIANYTFLPGSNDSGHIEGADCGPGNTLIDNAMRTLFNKPCDTDGTIASTGKIIPAVVKEIMKAAGKTKSTGREIYTPELLARIVYLARREKAGKNDIIASITEATVDGICRAIGKHAKSKPDGVYLTGGGRRNLYIVRRLTEKLKPLVIWPIEALGFDGDLLEAVSFAVLGGCYIHGIPSTLPNVTGAAVGGIAGKLSLPKKNVK
ncbi:MAG: anhydro-N-acetylmuramic acid kinase [Candidatus Zixiibacteriota bacterium]